MSTNTDLLHMALYIESEDEADDQLDRVTRRLRAEIETLDVESVQLLRDSATAAGTKSAEAVTIGALVMVALPAAIPPLLDLLKSWSLRGGNRKVKIKTEIKGQTVELEYSGAMSQIELETFRRLLMTG